ncbi:surfeit locus 1 family protein [Nitrosomonas aestuarii]|uniref:SURF1-like protein n=1 Tax=Nitrosomonas aestuarii TaxID=52441 RepID=A0A1I4EKN5_9PROT|nr:SURF1 family protein [Nitrosomonas aestuarii]SFL06292.1 surfeit locus 1 family protein [Nitrosomonas aestuarii]
MTLAGYQFKPKLWAVAITICMVWIFLELGKWQLSRADERKSRHEQLEQLSQEPVVTVPGSLIRLEDYQYRQVEARGKYRSEYTIFLDNKTYKGRAGYHVLTPLQIANSQWYVIINRGWVPVGYDRSILPEIPTVADETLVTGTVVSPELKMLELSDHTSSGVVWDSFNLERYKEMTGFDLQPIMILQKNKVEDGLIRDWDRPDSGASKNIGYAIQWFTLAITTIIIFLVLNVKRRSK